MTISLIFLIDLDGRAKSGVFGFAPAARPWLTFSVRFLGFLISRVCKTATQPAAVGANNRKIAGTCCKSCHAAFYEVMLKEYRFNSLLKPEKRLFTN